MVGLFSTRYIQCHNLVLIKDIHVHHMISSTVLNTDVHSIHGLVGIPRPTPLECMGVEIKVMSSMLATK